MTFFILLAGGLGERFWPKSRLSHPKQFIPIDGKESLIARSLRRLSGFPRRNLRIVASKEQGKVFQRRYPSFKKQILWEPFGRGTAAAVALAAFEVEKEDPEATLVVLPCDQWIRGEKTFLETLKRAEEVAKAFDGIVTIGARPTYPATGFGYICHAKRLERYGKGKAYRVKHFVEKPNLQKANRLLRGRPTLWNVGVFVFRLPVGLEAFRIHMPLLYKGFRHVVHIEKGSGREEALVRLYRRLRSISFDYGILEHHRNLLVVPAHFAWGDLGSWRSLERVHSPSRGGNLLIGDALIEDGRENIFVSEEGHLLAGIGISGLIAVHTPDATLICPKERAEKVKELVAYLKRRKEFLRYC